MTVVVVPWGRKNWMSCRTIITIIQINSENQFNSLKGFIAHNEGLIKLCQFSHETEEKLGNPHLYISFWVYIVCKRLLSM